MNGLISVIVATYNWPEALDACLAGLLAQSDSQFEILVADDGSQPETAARIAAWQAVASRPIRHVWHEDRGFRAGTIRNRAVAVSRGDYLLFVDGDCVTLPDFVARHRQLAETGYFVPGNRCLLSQAYTEQVLRQGLPLHSRSKAYFLVQRLCGRINRWLPLLYLPLTAWRYARAEHWQNAMTCNLAVWKDDFFRVNGFDEIYEGWGYEDSDLVIRLLHCGIRRKEGRFAAPVLHLWHRQNDRSRHDQNYQRLLARVADPAVIRAERGVGDTFELQTTPAAVQAGQ
ncbi:glycosyltransferase family 2 protein [Methylomonas sp. MED-D]|uniref:glycosyltransferase family 2 protein n=1 Tax=unclassified Methylomonas TaxID=2608980 RepID=UPI0008DB2ABB|nr:MULTISPECIES: glycosyltransferase family 2 protein [unclassified Methylomonas]MDT4330270.1 glycosyltransferase family 2 protein [Methylomonas sp. MV1]OHX38300.1 glycosyl transferase family 2 [Methylomonas sp. LWB]WGS86589.1 glycosyltransferase family 2 protein [Methylomonas sp. UP202]